MRSNKLNVWLILLGVSLLFFVFYYFLGKKFGIREGAAPQRKGKKTSSTSSENIPELNTVDPLPSSRGKSVTTTGYKPIYESSVKPIVKPIDKSNDYNYNYDTIKKSFGDLVEMAYEDHERLSRIEEFNHELATAILEEEKITEAY